MEKRKILFFVGASYVSGLEMVTLHLIRELKENGDEVRCVISGWNDGVFIGKLKALAIPFDEVKIGWLYLSKPRWTIDTLLHLPGAFWTCSKILNRFNPDICHFCGYSTIIMLYPLLKNRHCIFTLHEPHEPTLKHLFIYRLLNRRIATFTAVSKHIVNVLLKLNIPPQKISLTYNGVPVNLNFATLGKNTTPVILGIIGQVAPWKGHETLVDAAELLQRDNNGKFLVFVFGNDNNEFAEKLKLQIADKKLSGLFVWKGFRNDQDSIYAEVDFVVVPSLSKEPCSLTILESMMRRKLIVASDRGGNTELIDDGENGLIFKAGDAADLATCVARVLADRETANRMAINANTKALQHYTSALMRKAYDEVYATEKIR